MINAILNFSVRQRMLVILASLILTGFGILAVKQIPIDAFPDVTNVQVQVLATAGGMSPPEVEKLVTRPIEIQMGGLPRLDRNPLGFQDRIVRDHGRVRGRRERLLRATTRVRTAGKRARQICRPVSMSNSDRSRPASARFSNTRLSAMIRRNTTRPSCARCRITSCARFCARCRASRM